MITKEEIIGLARETVRIELDAIDSLLTNLGESFANAVCVLHEMKGRLVITGIGKSANIAQKIVATMNSTGTPAIFMHAADAIHGDLGMVQSEDVVMCISKSGNTPEIKVLVPLIKRGGNLLIGMVGNTSSFLADRSDFVLNTTVRQEACPNNLAPTSSTTSQLVMGDALAVCLLRMKNFSANDFARYHPGGALGKQLYLKVEDIYPGNNKPEVSPDSPMKEVIVEISSNRLGATAVVEEQKLVGIITDGDLRRMLQQGKTVETTLARDIMSPSPKVIQASELAVKALQMMEEHNITHLICTDEGGHYKGFVHFHDLMREGII